MSYKYRNGSTPDHVNSADSTSIPTPKIAPKDATNVVNASGPNADSTGDRNQANRLMKIGDNLSAQSDAEPNTIGGNINSGWKDMMAQTNYAQATKSRAKANAADSVKAKAIRTAGLSDEADDSKDAKDFKKK